MRRLLVFLAATMVLTGCARPLPDSYAPVATVHTGPSATGSPAVCGADGVMVTEGLSEAAMGLRVTQLNLINCGSEPYTVQGHPTLRLFDDDGDRLDVTVLTEVHEITASLAHFDAPPQRVTAAPGERLVAAVVWRNLTDSFDPTANAAFVEVTPAPRQPAHRIALESVIDLGNTGRLAVTAWRKAPNPPPTPGPGVTEPATPGPSPLL